MSGSSSEPAAVTSRRKVRLPGRARKNKPPKSADGSMTIVEHINELRSRILKALVAIGIGTVLGYIWYGMEVGPVPSLGEILRDPYCSIPPDMRFGASDGECRLLATSPFEMFILRLKVGSLAGLVFSSPFWLGQIWAYITPGLRKNEKRWTAAVGVAAGILFAIGAVLAYFVLSYGLEFLMGIGDEAQIAALNGDKYFSFAIGLLLIFGVSFEVPLITVLLNVAGVISYEQLQSKRRYIWAFLFVFAAFITPGQDPISMVVLAVALCFMMEMATQVARINDRRRKKQQADWLELDDEQGSTIEKAAPIGASSSIAGSGALGGSGVLDAAGSTGSAGGAAGSERIAASSIPAPSSLSDVRATPAPRSGSAARPRPADVDSYGRRDGLDLRDGGDSFDDVL